MSAHGNTAFVPEGQLRPLNRRGFMIGAAVAGAMASIPASAHIRSMPSRSAWDAAMARYVAAKAAMDVEDGEEVVGRFIDAEKAILGTRTPDMQAFRWKVERLRDISEHSVMDENDFDLLLADLAGMHDH